MPELRRRGRTYGRAAVALVAAAAVAVVTLFVTTRGPDDRSVQQLTPAPTPSPAKPDPLRLVGLWTVHAAGAPVRPGKFDVTAVRLAGNDGFSLIAFTPCGEYLGSWVTDTAGDFLAEVSGGSGTCLQGLNSAQWVNGRLAPWLSRTSSFVVEGSDVLLYDSSRHLTARLTPGAKVGPRPDIIADLTRAPMLDAATRRALRPARRPPAEGATITPDNVHGRWLPQAAGKTRQQPYLQLNENGLWDGLDGCNGYGGRWVLGADGAVLTTAGPSTLVGCDGAPIRMGQARTLRVVDGQLRLYDVDARLIGTFVRG